jgi:putative transcriptional regulator
VHKKRQRIVDTDLTDHFLIAMPTLDDPQFLQTVTYLCAYNREGAMGIVINRPLDLQLGDILSHMEIEVSHAPAQRLPVFQGGPVQPERGFVIHRPHGNWDAMLKVTPDIAITTSRDILVAIANGTGPQQMLIALGYAGWTAGQLEREMAANAWLSIPADDAVIFDVPTPNRWHAAAARLGIDINLLSPHAGHA